MSLLNKRPIIVLTRHSLVVWTEMVCNSWKWQMKAEEGWDEGTGIINTFAALFQVLALIRKSSNLLPEMRAPSCWLSDECCAFPSL